MSGGSLVARRTRPCRSSGAPVRRPARGDGRGSSSQLHAVGCSVGRESKRTTNQVPNPRPSLDVPGLLVGWPGRGQGNSRSRIRRATPLCSQGMKRLSGSLVRSWDHTGCLQRNTPESGDPAEPTLRIGWIQMTIAAHGLIRFAARGWLSASCSVPIDPQARKRHQLA